MKRILYIVAIAAIGSILTACKNDSPEWTEQYKEAKFYVVKFKPEAAQYRPHVMLVPDSKGKYRMRSLANGGTCKEFFLKHSPFIKVDTVQGWYMADWKWGVLLSYGHVVLPMRWEDVTRPDESYVRSDFEVAASGIIDKFGIVTRSDVDKYLHIAPAAASDQPGTWGYTSGGISTDHLAPVYLSRYFSVQDIPDVIDKKGNWQYTKQDFIQERLRQDSLQEVYHKRLETLIYSGMVNSVVKIVE